MPKPNARGKAALLIIAAIIFLVVGFVCGQIVKALTTLPGDADDPVATQSYVATQLGESLATLTTRLEDNDQSGQHNQSGFNQHQRQDGAHHRQHRECAARPWHQL